MKTFLLVSLLLCAAAAAPADNQPQAAEVAEIQHEAAPVEVSQEEASVSVNSDARFNFCPDGWFTHGSRCFLFVNSPMSWYNAEAHCNTFGANLASVSDTKENNFLQQLTQMSGQSVVWLGGFNLQGWWMWINREGFYYTNWYSSSSTSSSPCLFLRNTNTWGNTRCGNCYRFICSKNAFGC